MADVQSYLEWVKAQTGVTSARVDLFTKTMMLPEKLVELLGARRVERMAFSD
jgi:hypothetical protein